MNKFPMDRLRLLFGAMAISEPAFYRAKEILHGRNFPDYAKPCEFWLDTLVKIDDEYGKMLPLPLLFNRVEEELNNARASDDDMEEVSKIFESAEALAEAGNDEDMIAEKVSNYMTLFGEAIVRLKAISDIQTQELDIALLTAKDSLSSVRASDNDRFGNAFLKLKDRQWQGRMFPSGHPIFDLYTGGGPSTGDSVGHAAPSGGGKSTLASSIATTYANVTLSEGKKGAPNYAVSYIFNYEDTSDPLAQCLANLADVHRDKVDMFVKNNLTDQFSCRGKYTQEERKRWAKTIKTAGKLNNKSMLPRGEWERINDAIDKLAETIYVVDMTSRSKENARASTQLVEGLVSYIEEHQRRLKYPGVNGIFIDYAGMMARRYMSVNGQIDDKVERALLEDIPSKSKDLLSYPFETFTHISQQLSAEEASRKPGARPEPTKFKGCKSFRENLDFCYVNGVLVPDTGLATFVSSKTRRGKLKPDTIGRLDGDYSRWSLVDSGYVLGDHGIISEEEHREMQRQFFHGIEEGHNELFA